MNIIILTNIHNNGVTGRVTYYNALNYGLKLNGYNTAVLNVYYKKELQQKKYEYNIYYEEKDKILDICNKSDLVLCVDYPQNGRTGDINDFISILGRITTKKCVFINERSQMQLTTLYKHGILNDKKFLGMFDKIAHFGNSTKVYKKIEETLGEEIAQAKYVKLSHPYVFEFDKTNFVPLKDKKQCVSYFGRLAIYKDPMRLFKIREKLFEKNIGAEYFGTQMAINVVSPTYEGLKYINIQPGVTPTDISPYTKVLGSNKNLEKELKDIPKDVIPVHAYLYSKEDGIKFMKSCLAACNFVNYDYKDDNTDAIEYTIVEYAERGTLIFMDYHLSELVKLQDPYDGKYKPITELGIALCLKKDLSNADEIIEKLEYLANNEDEYNAMRSKAYDTFKLHTDPKTVAAKLVEDIFAEPKSLNVLF